MLQKMTDYPEALDNFTYLAHSLESYPENLFPEQTFSFCYAMLSKFLAILLIFLSFVLCFTISTPGTSPLGKFRFFDV